MDLSSFDAHLAASSGEYQHYIDTLCAVIADCQKRGNTVGLETALVLLEAEVLSLVAGTN